MSSEGVAGSKAMLYSSKTSKWLELEVPIRKYNNAIPYFVEILKSYHGNITKMKKLNQEDYSKRQYTEASKTVKQLTFLLSEMDNLRAQVPEIDIKKFDKLISSSRQSALNAIKSHQDLSISTDSAKILMNDVSTTNAVDIDLQDQQLQIVANLSEDIRKQEQRAASLERFQEDVEEVHSLYQELSQLVHHQGENVDKVEDFVETTHHNVIEGETMLCQAAKYKSSVYPMVGALLGSVVGGPVGLVAGFKLGGLSAMACAFLGFTGGKLLKNQNDVSITEAECHRKELIT